MIAPRLLYDSLLLIFATFFAPIIFVNVKLLHLEILTQILSLYSV